MTGPQMGQPPSYSPDYKSDRTLPNVSWGPPVMPKELHFIPETKIPPDQLEAEKARADRKSYADPETCAICGCKARHLLTDGAGNVLPWPRCPDCKTDHSEWRDATANWPETYARLKSAVLAVLSPDNCQAQKRHGQSFLVIRVRDVPISELLFALGVTPGHLKPLEQARMLRLGHEDWLG